jgi:predicted RNase H-like nuclease (RuvC/YqgF family)|tara:strand:- start:881 stop:1243 length:363 start_codon:yes stop_codon:yes gene_type:complete
MVNTSLKKYHKLLNQIKLTKAIRNKAVREQKKLANKINTRQRAMNRARNYMNKKMNNVKPIRNSKRIYKEIKEREQKIFELFTEFAEKQRYVDKLDKSLENLNRAFKTYKLVYPVMQIPV